MRRAALILIVIAAAFSCTQPPSREMFISREKAEYGDTYAFDLDLSDTTVTFDVTLVTMFERKPFIPFGPDSLAVAMKWVSPSDSVYSDTTYVEMRMAADSTYFIKEVLTPLTVGPGRPENGTWRLMAKVKDAPEAVRGLGIICSRNDGTR